MSARTKSSKKVTAAKVKAARAKLTKVKAKLVDVPTKAVPKRKATRSIGSVLASAGEALGSLAAAAVHPESAPDGVPKTVDRAAWAERIVADVWPQERDFLERPERYRYVRKLLPDQGCVFCVAAATREPSFDTLVLGGDDLVQVVMNKYPYNTGHLLITPRDHRGTLADLDDAIVERLARWQKRCVVILKEALGCQGFNLGLNQGAVAGAGIPDHLHWHVVPRWGGDVNFFPLIAETKVLPQTLEQTYTKLRPYFAERS